MQVFILADAELVNCVAVSKQGDDKWRSVLKVLACCVVAVFSCGIVMAFHGVCSRTHSLDRALLMGTTYFMCIDFLLMCYVVDASLYCFRSQYFVSHSSRQRRALAGYNPSETGGELTTAMMQHVLKVLLDFEDLFGFMLGGAPPHSTFVFYRGEFIGMADFVFAIEPPPPVEVAAGAGQEGGEL